jgi:acetyl-CoA hydrolase
MNRLPVLSAEEAAAAVPDGAFVAFSGFTPSGAAKAVPRALAAQAKELHRAGRPFALRVLTGASTGKSLDDALADAGAISWRAPYQSSRALRDQINAGEIDFLDMHLSHVPQYLDFGFIGPIDFAIVEATEVTPDGRIYLSSSVGASPTFLRHAAKIIVEVNRAHSTELQRLHDVSHLPLPPDRRPIPINHPMDRIGLAYEQVDPSRIVGIVETNEADEVTPFSPVDATSSAIAAHTVEFLSRELRAGRIPKEFLPLQSGVGNIANAVMAELGAAPAIPPFWMYTEVFQEALPALVEQGRLCGASTTSLTVTPATLKRITDNMDLYAKHLVLRPQEYTNHPGVVRRLGVISMNTALEVDIYGHANSTHVCGTTLMNGIGGSGDFTRNAYLSIFMCPSVAKGGAISAIVPFCSHVDHNEHSVNVVVTEQGVADLRGIGPAGRAQLLIEVCAHPDYRPVLREYLRTARVGHERHRLGEAFRLHENYVERGHMLRNG